MSDVLAPRFRRLFDYEKGSHARVLAALAAVPAERRAAAEFQRALDLFAHVLAARRMWLGRLGWAPKTGAPLEPQGTRLEELGARLAEVDELWTRALAERGDAELAQSFEYQSLDAGRFRNTLDDVLTQLYGHALYHRGQIALCLKALGVQPPTTDFILWSRVALG